jgi:hypothetical protein
MLSALLGLIGVLVGALLTQLFAASSEWRNRRLDAMVAVAAASSRVIGAHERLHELFVGGESPPLSDERVIRALTERSDAHNDWRIARSRLIILIPDDQRLIDATDRFERYRRTGTRWVHAYLKDVQGFLPEDIKDLQTDAWVGMRESRIEIGNLCRMRSQRDTRWGGRLRRQFMPPATPKQRVIAESEKAVS